MRPVHTLRPALGLLFLSVLVACSSGPEPDPRRLVLVTQPQADGAGAQAFAGEVRAREEVTLSFRVPGKIAERLVDAGAPVRAGQVLARLDAADLTLQRQGADAAVQALKAERDLAAAELVRYRDLAAQQLVSKSLYDSKKAQAEAAQSRYRQAAAQAGLNANQSGYAAIRAPGPGVIIQSLAEAGQVVSAGQPVFSFARDGGREVAIHVAERHLSFLRVGQPVAVELWTEPGKRRAGRVREIAGAADALTRTYAVRVALADSGAGVHLGQSARVLMADARDVSLTVPLSALTENAGKPAVWVLSADGRLRKRSVQVLRYGARTAELGSSVGQNEWIVQAGVHLLREGEAVRAVDADNRPVRTGAAR